MNESFHPLFQLHEGAEVRQAGGDFPVDLLAASRYFRSISIQGSGVNCFVPRRILVLLAENVDDDLDLLSDLEQLGGVGDLPPAHVGDVEEPYNPAEIDERPEIGQGPDLPLTFWPWARWLNTRRRFFSRSSWRKSLRETTAFSFCGRTS